MELIADILLVAGALGAGLYCFVLSRRLRRFTNLERGVGGAVAVLSTQADELKKSLDSARDASDQSGAVLKELTQRAETVAQRLELMMASMHDVVPPEEQAEESAPTAAQKDATEESAGSTEEEQVESTEAIEKPDESGIEEFATAPAKRPSGLMFFRHDRSQGGAAT